MLRRVRGNARLLEALRDVDLTTRRTFLGGASASLVEALVDAIRLVLQNRGRLPPSDYIALRRQARNISAVVNPRTSLDRKRRILQSGGFLNLVLPLLGNLLGLGGRR